MASEPKGKIIIPVWYDGTLDEIKALITDNGRVPVSIDEENVDLDVHLHTYDGSAWHKSPLVFGYTDRLYQSLGLASAPAGANILSTSLVPAGEVWRLETISAADSNNSPTYMLFVIRGTGVWYPVYKNSIPLGGVYDIWTGLLTLKEGDYVSLYFYGVTLNDNLVGYVSGYKMKVNM